MAKFEHIVLNIKDNELQNFEELRQIQKNTLSNGNVIYIYRSSKSKKIYIGQTKHFITRHRQHYSGKEKKFNDAEFDQVIVLISTYFNGSALDDVESQLITYFIADNPSKKKQQVSYDQDKIINLTGGNSVNDYAERENVALEVILPFWEKVLAPMKWVSTPTLDELKANALVKYSPIKQLTEQQSQLINEILSHDKNNYVINGDAGTGKTVLLTHLVAQFLQSNKDKSIAIVVQPNWIKIATEIFKVYGLNRSNLKILSSTKLIKLQEKFDTIIVDEAHKLSKRGPKQMYSFNSIYKIPDFSSCESHLEPLLQLSDQLILMYDVLQAIRPANISRTKFRELTSDFEQRYLTTQFRIQAPKGKSYTSEDYINGIKYLLYKDTGLLELTNFNPNFDRSLFFDNDLDAYFGFFEDQPLKNLIDWTEEDNNYNPEHVNRVLSGLVEPWRQADGNNPSITHFHEGNISRRWNSTQENWINSKDKDAKEQIGSVFAVQGIDLNKVGVLIGNDLLVNDKGELYGEPDNFHNVNGKHSKSDLELPETRQEFTHFVLNIYYVLLTRGIDGVRIGFWHNNDFKNYFKDTFNIK